MMFFSLNRFRAYSLLLITSCWLAACSSNPPPAPATPDLGLPDNMDPNRGRYSQDKDSIPLRRPTDEELIDPIPEIEPLSRGGNKPYNIYGIDYSPNISMTQYSEVGTASWYGNKFHGHLTSNGEVYNVFAMTAAHKTLPLPSYVRVTNLANNKTAIVRVNDRGPFHQGRIIDLSYSAAYKLGIFPAGTGRVKVELITSPAMDGQNSFGIPMAKDDRIPYQPVTPVARPVNPVSTVRPAPTTVRPQSNSNHAAGHASVNTLADPDHACYIQLVASSNLQNIQQLGNQLQQRWSIPSRIESGGGLHRLLAGPFQGGSVAQQQLQQLKAADFPSAFFKNKQYCG